MGLFDEEIVKMRTWVDTSAPDCVQWKSEEPVRQHGPDAHLIGQLLNFGGKAYAVVDDPLFSETFAAPIKLEDDCMIAYHIRPAAITDAPPWDDICDVCGTGAAETPPDIEITISGVTSCPGDFGADVNGTIVMAYDSGGGFWFYENGSTWGVDKTVEIAAICIGEELLVAAVARQDGGSPGDAWQATFEEPVNAEESMTNIFTEDDCDETAVVGYGGTAIMKITGRTCCGGTEEDDWPETISVTVSGNGRHAEFSWSSSSQGCTNWTLSRSSGSVSSNITLNFLGFNEWGAQYGATIRTLGDNYPIVCPDQVDALWNQYLCTTEFIVVTIEGLGDECMVRVWASKSGTFLVVHPDDGAPESDCSHPDFNVFPSLSFGGTFFAGEGTLADATGGGISSCCPTQGGAEVCGQGGNCTWYWGGTCTIVL